MAEPTNEEVVCPPIPSGMFDPLFYDDTLKSGKLEREDGFYWVKDGCQWTIAQWLSSSHPKGWVEILGNTQFNRDDKDFEKIDERRIERLST